MRGASTAAAAVGRRSMFFYVLVEHQSTVEPRMPLRMLGYLRAAYERLAPPSGPLPVIIPLLVSHAEGGWAKSRSLRELFDLDPELERLVQKHLPSFELLIDDLVAVGDEQLRARGMPEMAYLTLVLLKVVRTLAS